MRVRLERRESNEDTVTLGARVTFNAAVVRLRYATRTGAILRIDGAVGGAFDGKHAAIDVIALAGRTRRQRHRRPAGVADVRFTLG